jgi:hypothetical protein
MPSEADEMRTLAESLIDYPKPLLQGIAEMRGVVLAGGTLRQMVDQLAAALNDADSVASAVHGLSPAAQAALARLVAAHGRMTIAAFTRVAGAIRAFGPGRLACDEPWREPANAAEELWYRALIARAFAATEQGATEFVYVPTDILPLLPPLAQGARPSISLVPVSFLNEGEPRLHGVPDALLEDACTLLIFVQAHAPWARPGASLDSLGTTSAWRGRDLETLRAQMLEPQALSLLLHLAGKLGWLRLDGGRLRLEMRTARGWLDGTRQEQRRVLFLAWRDAPDWNDLCHVPGLRCVETGWRNDPLLARRAILGHLTRCAGGWYSLDALVAAIREADPDFQRPDGDYNSWYIQDETTSRYLRGFEDWPRVEGALITHLVTGPLQWLGLVKVAWAEKEKHKGNAIFCLAPAGVWLLGLGKEPEEPAPARLQMHDDFTVTVPPGARLLDRFRLARVAVPLPGPATPVGGWHYRLSRYSLARAQRQGLSPERVLAFLQEASGGQVPKRVAAALIRVAAAPVSPASRSAPARRLRLRRLTVIQAEPALLRELRGRVELVRFLRQELAPGMVVVDEKNLAALRLTLHQLGYAVVTGGDPADRSEDQNPSGEQNRKV